jgi:hypothetical protein
MGRHGGGEAGDSPRASACRDRKLANLSVYRLVANVLAAVA